MDVTHTRLAGGRSGSRGALGDRHSGVVGHTLPHGTVADPAAASRPGTAGVLAFNDHVPADTRTGPCR